MMVPHSINKEILTPLNTSQPVGPRASERLRFKSKLIECKKQTPKPPPRPVPTIEENHDVIDLALRSIEPGNPAHKLLFITCLGLVPKSDAKIPPYIHLKRLPSSLLASKPTSDDSFKICNDEEYSDIEDLDLELVYCPLDIPEIYEEITKKRCPTASSIDDIFNNSDCCSNNGESGYESSTNGGEKTCTTAPSKRLHSGYKSTVGKCPRRGPIQQQSPPLIDISDDDEYLSKASSISTVTIRRTLRIPVATNLRTKREEYGKSQVVRNQSKILTKNLVNHSHWSPRNVSSDVSRKILLPTQNPAYLYEVPKSIEMIKRRLLALHTDMEYVDG